MLREYQRQIASAVLAGLAALIGAETISTAEERLDGKALFEKRCGGCHTLDRDKEGPRLGGVYGRKAGTVESFQYSDALRNSGIVWSDDTLDRWLTDTGALVPDNDMTFRVPRADERKAIIEYLTKSSTSTSP